MRLRLATASWGAVAAFQRTGQPPAFVPVRVSVGVPRFILGAEHFPHVRELAPYGLLREPALSANEFEAAFEARLNCYGPERIAARLEAIGLEYAGRVVVLCCFERDAEDCHRSHAARWLEARLGIRVPEMKPLKYLPTTPP